MSQLARRWRAGQPAGFDSRTGSLAFGGDATDRGQRLGRDRSFFLLASGIDTDLVAASRLRDRAAQPSTCRRRPARRQRLRRRSSGGRWRSAGLWWRLLEFWAASRRSSTATAARKSFEASSALIFFSIGEEVDCEIFSSCGRAASKTDRRPLPLQVAAVANRIEYTSMTVESPSYSRSRQSIAF